MELTRFTVVSEAPLDEHTYALLASLAPAHVAVADAIDPASTLRDWAAVASGATEPLVLTDSSLRAESNALANLLDDPGVRTGVLLAHHAIEGVNSEVLVDDDGYLAAEGTPAQTAGIMVVDHSDCPAFADALLAAAAGAQNSREHPWDLALAALMSTRRVRAVPAAPFCASRQGMEIPTRSEHDRKLRAAAGPNDDPTARLLIRPASRRLTNWAVTRGVPPGRLTALGLWVGLVAVGLAASLGIAAMPPLLGVFFALLSAVALVTAGLFFLSSGESVRYLRRGSERGQRHYGFSRRLVDVGFLTALSLAAVSIGPSGAMIAVVALAAVGVSASLAASHGAVTGSKAGEHWPLRWLLTAIAVAIGGPMWGLIVATAVAVGSAVFMIVDSTHRSTTPVFAVNSARRFLAAPGVLVDAGIPARLLSTATLPGPTLAPNLAVSVAISALAIGAVTSWGQRPWVMLVTAAAAVVLLSMSMRKAPQGRWAWLLPTVARLAEFLAVIVVASYLGGLAPALVVAATLMLTGDTADRWRLRRRPPLPWVPVTGLGFDGRMLVVLMLAAVVPGIAPALVGVVAGLVALTWVAAVAGFWRPSDA